MTTKTTHTPAPWQAMQFDESQTVIFPVAKGPLIAIVSVGDGRPDGPANVALFLAAPMMLQALRELTKEVNLSKLNISKDFSLINAHNSALKAIYYAEGKE